MIPVIGVSMSSEQEKRLFVNKEYADAIFEAGGIPLLLPYTTDSEVIEEMAHKCDGLLLTGGGDIDPTLFGEEPIPGLGEIVPERDEMEIQLIQTCLEQQKPVLAICRGMQILNVALGGDMYQDLAAQKQPLLQHAQVAPRSHASHTIQITESSLLHQIMLQTNIKVNSYHHQAVRQVAPSLQASAYTSDGVIEAIESTSHPFVLGVQWHPECMTQKQKEAKAIFRTFVDACKKAIVNKAV